MVDISKKNILSFRARMLLYAYAWKSKQKIVVIESDDWGSIRTSSEVAFDYLVSNGYNMENSVYSYDSLETNEDLEYLYEILSAHVDSEGNPACFTANVILANPDFDKIKRSDFQEYYYETVQETASTFKKSNRIIELWKNGYNNNLFYPQVHAREHVKYWTWLSDLKNGMPEAVQTFQLGMCGVPQKVSKTGTSYYSPLYSDEKILRKNDVHQTILVTEAFQLFESLFGFPSKSTIAPNCGWTDETEKIWKQNGVKYIQGGFLQEHHKESHIQYIPRYLGEKSTNTNLIYLVRNCTFEPSKSKNNNYWQKTLRQVERSFKLNTPAIISTHRINYTGSINENIRSNSLKQLDTLLRVIKEKWPDILFYNSVQLGDAISQ